MRYTRHSGTRRLRGPPISTTHQRHKTAEREFNTAFEMVDSCPDAQQIKRKACACVCLCAIMRVDSKVMDVGALQAPN